MSIMVSLASKTPVPGMPGYAIWSYTLKPDSPSDLATGMPVGPGVRHDAGRSGAADPATARSGGRWAAGHRAGGVLRTPGGRLRGRAAVRQRAVRRVPAAGRLARPAEPAVGRLRAARRGRHDLQR